MIEVIQKNWLDYFLSELNETNSVYLISPFVTKNIVDHLLHNGSAKIQLITRFNLNDFRSKVSSLSALKMLVEKGAEIKGIKNLHSKVYLFDNKSVIIGSANFTSGGFFNNYEYGIKTSDNNTIIKTSTYFNSLWNISQEVLTITKIEEWENELRTSRSIPKNDELPDYGQIASIQGSTNRKYFIKLFGKTEHRVDLDFTSRNEIERSHCHWALTFSGKKGRPRKYNDGDVVYMARMLHGTDYAIFGKGFALKHVDERDVASDLDIDEIDWKEDWPIYIRVQNPEFVDSSMRNCPKMSELIDTLQYDSFDKTQRKYLNGDEDINVWASLRQQADVQLSEIAAEWLENKFQEARIEFGAIPQDYINNLYSGTPSLHEILNNE
jgi:HKD family nuclease